MSIINLIIILFENFNSNNVSTNIKKYLSNYYVQQIVFVSIIIIFFLLLILPNFFTKSSTTEEITITYADNLSDAHKILIYKFNEENKGKIKIEPIDLPFDKFSTNERKELLARSLRSKSDKIDIFAVDLIWVARFAKWCEPLNLKELEGIENKLLKYSLESCYYKDKIVALPLYIDIGLMYYRKDILEKIPNFKEFEVELINSITWERFIELGKSLRDKGNPFYIYQAENFEGLVCSLSELLINLDPDFYNSEINFTSNKAKYALQLLVDLVQKNKLSPNKVTEFKENNSWEYFIKNDGLFLRGWPGFERDRKEMLKKYNIEKSIVKIPLPHLKGSKPTSVYGGWNLMISKFSKHKKEALEFIKFLLREESQKVLYNEAGYLPVLESLYNNKFFLEENPDLKYYEKLLNNGVHRPFLNDYTRISDILSYYSNKAIRGEIDVSSALEAADKYIKTESFIIK